MARSGQGLPQQPRHGPGDHTNTLYVVTIGTPCTQDQDRGDLHSTASTPTPPTSHPGLETVVKDENGQDIVCVVCNDKSSGKHYGQFTCEGRGALLTLLIPSLILDLPAPSVHYLCSGQQTTLRITRPIYQGVSGHCALCSYTVSSVVHCAIAVVMYQ